MTATKTLPPLIALSTTAGTLPFSQSMASKDFFFSSHFLNHKIPIMTFALWDSGFEPYTGFSFVTQITGQHLPHPHQHQHQHQQHGLNQHQHAQMLLLMQQQAMLHLNALQLQDEVLLQEAADLHQEINALIP